MPCCRRRCSKARYRSARCRRCSGHAWRHRARGCDESVRDSVLLGKADLNPSENKYDWLGNGIYFWENNHERALSFAKELRDNPRPGKTIIKKPAVLGAIINL